jgi:hypothetical protein
LSRALRAVAEIVGEDEARKMVIDRPKALLEGREPEAPPAPERVPSRRSLLSRWFRRGEAI